MDFQKVQLGRNTYKSCETALEDKGSIDLKINCMLTWCCRTCMGQYRSRIIRKVLDLGHLSSHIVGTIFGKHQLF